MSDWIFQQRGTTYVPSGHARGPWDPGSQHGGAAAALLAREIERVEQGEDMVVARITYEFLGPVPLAPLEADAWIQRPGRRFQLVEAELREGGRSIVRARAVRLRRGIEGNDGAHGAGEQSRGGGGREELPRCAGHVPAPLLVARRPLRHPRPLGGGKAEAILSRIFSRIAANTWCRRARGQEVL